MRCLRYLLALLFVINSTSIFSQDLKKYQWKNRIILLKANTLQANCIKEQLKNLETKSLDLLEREVLLFIITDKVVYDILGEDSKLDAGAILQKYKLINFEGLVLIGKDGETKLKEEFVVNPSKIINLIDGMPMRIREIQEKNH